MLASMATQAPVTLIVGEEEFLVDRTVRELVASARAAMAEAGDGGGDLHEMDASALAPGELTTLTSPSLFGGGCVVILRRAQDAGKDVAAELAKYTAAPAPDAVLVLTHAGGAKGKALVTDLTKAGAQVVECPKLTRISERTDFVKAEFRRVGGGPARVRHRGADRRGRRGQVLPRPGGGDRVQRGRPRGRGTPERGA